MNGFFKYNKMNNSLGSTIEKIKKEEISKEAKLKAKREQEAASAAAERAIRDAVAQLKKLQQDEAELTKRTDDLRAQVTIQKIRRDALSSQLSASSQELQDLRTKLANLTSEVQGIRATYCNAVQEASDECDVWALLTKPSFEEVPCAMAANAMPPEPEKQQSLADAEKILQVAIEKLEKAIAERERLKSEPDNGEEFIRIKNALRYSLEMTANVRK